MAIIRVFTDDDKFVDAMTVDDNWSSSARNRNIVGITGSMQGWLDRALTDARKIQMGIDPERVSEKVMRLLAEQEAAASVRLDGETRVIDNEGD